MKFGLTLRRAYYAGVRQDFSKRLIIVVRGDLEGWQSSNAIAHISAYIGNRLWNSFGTGENFTSADAKEYPRNSQYPIIIKRAGSSSQLRTLLEKTRHADMMHHAFIREMLDHEDDHELQAALAKKNDDTIELLGVGLFGENDKVALLTKKFGLWK